MTGGDSKLPVALFLTAKAYKNNPMLKMYGSALVGSHQCVFSCIDYSSKSINGAQFVPAPHFLWGYFLNILARLPFGFGSYYIRSRGWVKILAWLISPLFFLDYLLSNLRQLYIAQTRLSGRNVRFVVAVDGDFLLASFLSAKLNRARFFYSVYEVWPDQIPPAGVWELSAKLARTCIEYFFCYRASRIITVTKAWSKLVRRRYSLSQSKFIEVPVCPVSVAIPDEKVHDPVRFHYHGGYLLSRGLAELVRAFQRVEGALLYLRGYGPDEQRLKELVRELGLDSKIFFLPPVAVHELVAQAVDYDVGVIIAKPDTANGRMCTGFKCFEYLNSGLALLAPSSLPLRAFIRENGCGINYGWPDETIFQDVIRRVIENRQVLLALKMSARSVSNEFNAYVQGAKLHTAMMDALNG